MAMNRDDCVFVDPLLPHRDQGLADVRHVHGCGVLPSHRCTVFELVISHDAMASADHLLMRTVLRDRLTGEIIESRRDICRALPIGSADEARIVYVREMCQMIAPHVRAWQLTLSDLREVIHTMNASWNILGVFQALDSVDALQTLKRMLPSAPSKPEPMCMHTDSHRPSTTEEQR